MKWKNKEFKEWFQIEGKIRTKVLHIHKKKTMDVGRDGKKNLKVIRRIQ